MIRASFFLKPWRRSQHERTTNQPRQIIGPWSNSFEEKCPDSVEELSLTTSEILRGRLMASTTVQKLSLFALTGMVVGSMVGSGIFSLPRTFGNATGPFGAIVAWIIAAGGMYTLARVFQLLAERKPD